jgi:hypothetical protein
VRLASSCLILVVTCRKTCLSTCVAGVVAAANHRNLPAAFASQPSCYAELQAESSQHCARQTPFAQLDAHSTLHHYLITFECALHHLRRVKEYLRDLRNRSATLYTSFAYAPYAPDGLETSSRGKLATQTIAPEKEIGEIRIVDRSARCARALGE